MPDSVETLWKHPAPKVLFRCYSGCYSASANAVFRVYLAVYRVVYPGPRMPVSMDAAPAKRIPPLYVPCSAAGRKTALSMVSKLVRVQQMPSGVGRAVINPASPDCTTWRSHSMASTSWSPVTATGSGGATGRAVRAWWWSCWTLFRWWPVRARFGARQHTRGRGTGEGIRGRKKWGALLMCKRFAETRTSSRFAGDFVLHSRFSEGPQKRLRK